MIPHAPPMRFPEAAGVYTVPADHPLVQDGQLGGFAAVELAAQAAGRALGAPGQRGMLVEVEDLTVEGGIPVGARVVPEVIPGRRLGPLVRCRVNVPGVLSVQLTLRLESA